ncbi:MAG: hypothetical protein V3U19_08655, partial [Thermodesulfobacteriota bacterium]
MKAYRKFHTEIKRLKRLYLATKFSFNETSSLLKERLKNDLTYGYTKLSIGDDEEDSIIASSIFEFKSKLSSQYPRYLRELIFIRVISALEVFLIDSLKELFKSNKEPFKNNDVLQFTRGELLSIDSMSVIYTKLINNDCRNLHSGGFLKIKNYYSTKLHIDLDNYCDSEKLEEFHDRRHILVHNLGTTDSKYRSKYAVGIRRLTVDEPYLLDCFMSISLLCEKVDGQLTLKYLNTEEELDTKIEYPVYCEVLATIIKEEVKNLFHSNHQYWVENRLILLSDILESKKQIDENNFELTIRGDSKAVRGYIQELKLCRKNGYLNFKL